MLGPPSTAGIAATDAVLIGHCCVLIANKQPMEVFRRNA